MRKSWLKLAFVTLVLQSIFSVSAPEPANAQRSLALTIYNGGVKAYDKGDYREALRAFRQCQELLKTTKHTEVEEAQLLYSLGETLRCMGEFKDSEETLKRAMTLNDNVPKKFKNDFWLFNGMAGLYMAKGKFAEAEALWKQDEVMLGWGDTRTCYPVNNLCQLYFSWGKIDEASEYVKKAVKLSQRAKKSLAMPYSILNLAQLQ